MVSCKNFSLEIEVLKTPISLHWFWYIFYALGVATSLVYKSLLFTVLVAITEGPILLLTVLIHELGFVAMAKLMGGTVHRIVLWPFGGFAKIDLHDKGPKGDLLIAIAGPFTHIPQAAAWFGLFLWASKGDMWYYSYAVYLNQLEENFPAVLFCSCTNLNICLFCFHMLPAYPLGGGHALGAIMLMRKVDKARVATVVAKSGLVVAVLLCINGVVDMILWDNSDFGFWSFMIAFIVVWYSTALFKRVADRNFDGHPIFYSTREASTNTVAAPAPATATNAETFELEGGQVATPATGGGKNKSKQTWFLFGGKKKSEKDTTNKEPEIDYGF